MNRSTVRSAAESQYEVKMSKALQGKVAIITGAASGIGEAVSRLFHENGAKLVLADVSVNVIEIAEELGEHAVAFTGDVSNSVDTVKMIELAVSTFGALDILCNIAGIPGERGSLVECSDENFERLIGVNLRAPFLAMKSAIPYMIARGGGAIVNVASTAALKGYPSAVVYGASKAGVVSLTRGAAIEYAKHNIRINAVCPGPIETPMYQAAVEGRPEAAERIVSGVPMGRLGKPMEIASVVLFFASSSSSFVTGAVLPVEGGQVA